jgi:hypothetical protein
MDNLHIFPYRIQVVQELGEDNTMKGGTECLNRLMRLIISDDNFEYTGYVNKQK